MGLMVIVSVVTLAKEVNDLNMTQKSKKFTISEVITNDYQSFYTSNRLMYLGIGFISGALLSHTVADKMIKNANQEDRNIYTDKLSKIVKLFGEGKYLIPISLLSASIYFYKPESLIGTWGVYTSRAYIVGTPILLTSQLLTGGSRPNEISYESRWKPFNDNNGVSGHAFIGSVPFITLAHIYEDNPTIKYLAYGGSLLTAWSRINDNKHYFSQVLLGWYLAYESVDAVFDSDRESTNFSVTPHLGNKRYGIQIEMRW